MKRQSAWVVVLAGVAAVLAGRAASGQGTWRVSVDSSGGQAEGASGQPSISACGRFVAFASNATDLVPDDSSWTWDVFVHDRATGITTRVSLDSSGNEADNHSMQPSISADGRCVAFMSKARNLVPDDTNGWDDVFVHDRQTGTTTRVSVDSSGNEGDGLSIEPAISADGRFVVFKSRAKNLAPGSLRTRWSTYVHDRQTGVTKRVSVDSNGVPANRSSHAPAISGDGRWVTFYSPASNLVAGDTNGLRDIFVHDCQTGETTRASVDSAGTEGNDHCYLSSISADGRFVAFESVASNLVADDTNGSQDIFVHDRETGRTTRVSVDSHGGEGQRPSVYPSISADGRFVAFGSLGVLVPEDTNGWYDVYLHDRQTGQTRRSSVSSSGAQGDRTSASSSISRGARFVAFDSMASNLVPDDTNAAFDVFVHGAYLTLEATPETVAAGDTLAFATWSGQPAGPVLLAVVDVGGTALFQTLALGSFDGEGLWTLSGTVPAGLSGILATFQSFGQNPTGRADRSNAVRITFQ